MTLQLREKFTEDESILLTASVETIALEAGEDGGHRSEIQIMQGGTYEHPFHGMLLFDRTLFDRLAMNFSGNVVGRQLAMDSDHMWRQGAYGWFESVRAMGEMGEGVAFGAQLFATIRWTQKGVDAIQGEEYKYTSVEFSFNFKDQHGRLNGPTLLGAALTNRPFIAGMREVTLNAGAHPGYFEEPELSSKQHHPVTLGEPVATPDPEKEPTMPVSETVKNALEALGLTEGSTPDADSPEIVAFLATVREKSGIGPEVDNAALLTAVIASVGEMTTDPSAADPTPDPAPPADPTPDPAPPADPTPDPTPDPSTADSAVIATLTQGMNDMKTALAEKDVQLTTMSTELAGIREDKRVSEGVLLTTEARQDGKLSPAMLAEWGEEMARENPVQFKAMMETMPVQPALLAEMGSTADAMATVGADGNPVVEFETLVANIQNEESVGPDKAYTLAKQRDQALYNRYMDVEGRGVKARRERKAALVSELQQTL